MSQTTAERVIYPGTRAPDRERLVDSWGVAIKVYEWGAPDANPLMLAHGGFDFSRTYDVFAPMLADAGWRVVAWDHRGHGDSEHTALYSWEADQRDAVAVFDSTTSDPVPVIGHSKGGNMLLQMSEYLPHRIAKMVNIDGMPSPRRHLEIVGHERTRMLEEGMQNWLSHRRAIADLQRKAGTIDELAKRRGRMNPRLSPEWLQYLVTVGARHDSDGWRWKIDPQLRFGGFGPWRHTWSLAAMHALSMPVLVVIGTEPEEMGWGITPDQLQPFLPASARIEVFDQTGHFVHIEKPREVADMVLDFLSERQWS
jgi:pimeloyl-ACP methyl ester carboxylesterase